MHPSSQGERVKAKGKREGGSIEERIKKASGVRMSSKVLL
jgi:hypothetical protein